MDKDNLEKLCELHKLTPEQHAECLQKIITTTFYGKTPVENPVLKVIMAQTGAGKNSLTELAMRKNPNAVLVAGDNCKPFRYDAVELAQKYPTDFNAKTRYDSHLHMFEVFEQVRNNNYNAIVEKAPSVSFKNFWGGYTVPDHYRTEYDILAVSELNSVLSTRERYEQQILFGAKSPKLTEIERHDDSFVALQQAIDELDDSTINVYIRGNCDNKIPLQVYPSQEFRTAKDCIHYYRELDTKKTLKEFSERYKLLRAQMLTRNAPKEQFEQLVRIYRRYEKMISLYCEKER